MNNNLLEYSDKSNFESYTGIVLDKENNAFKIIKGMFRDKKDFYEKAKKRGLILRKCFESSIFEWIEDNAPDDVIQLRNEILERGKMLIKELS